MTVAVEPSVSVVPTSPARAGSAEALRIAYMTGQYPRASDTFIQREIAGLRAGGAYVQSFSIRRPGAKENVGPETEAERERTYYILPPRVGKILGAHVKLLVKSPGRYVKGMKAAMTLRPPGVKATIMQLIYFAEAGVVAAEMNRQNLSHLHNHFADSSLTVALIAAELGGFTYSFTIHGPAEFFEPTYWRLDEKARRALFVSCISHYCRSQTMIFTPQEKWDRLHIVHCGVDPSLFTPVKHEGVGNRLAFVGRLAGVKGLPMLLDAVAKVRRSTPGVKLQIAGDGPDRGALERQAKALGIESAVTFLGNRSQTQVRELLHGSDIFVMGSFAEGVPVVLMEAMAAGVPVVATQIAGIPELVENGVNGILVPPADGDSLAAAIGELAADPALRQRMGENGRQKVSQEFNIHHEAARLGLILTSALDGKVVETRPAVVVGEANSTA